MRRKIRFAPVIFLTLFLAWTASESMAQYRIHGTVFDRSTGEHLVAATVYDTLGQRGTVTNEYGFFSLHSQSYQVLLNCSYVGYKSLDLRLDLDSDTSLNLYLSPSLEIEEVTVSARSADRDFLSSQMSAHSINHMEAHKMPLLFGETDLIKSLQYLPGVSSGVEGTSGIMVRGGGPDQNLILLDGVPVYNVNHLFGLFSVFNGDAINSATIYKGGFPARYSGRLSSVLDIRMKEGNMQEFHGAASIGLIASKIMLEGPIVRDRTSFLVSARRTYVDVLSYPVQYLINKSNGRSTKSYLGYFFHDINAKINHKFSDHSRLYLSTYAGKDEFYNRDNNVFYDQSTGQSLESKYRYGFSWGNWTTSLRWNHIWSGSLFSNLTLSYSTFRHREYEEDQAYYSYSMMGPDVNTPTLVDEYYNRVRDLSARLDFAVKPFKGHDIRAGIQGNLYNFEPGTSIEEHYFPEHGIFSQRSGADTVRATQWTAFLEDDFSIGNRFRANLGFNASLFQVEGKYYFRPEPRFSARYLLSDRLVLKASYSEMSQYLHLLTNAMVGLPTDSWVPSTSTLPPEESWQAAVGLNYKFRPGIRFSLEGFYKEMDNLVEYAEGAELQMNDKLWEERVLSGSGRAYGLEFFVEKERGRWTGSLAYTLSKNTRQFTDINFGESFPYKYDRRHDLSITANWQIKDHISLGAVWVLASGINVTNQDHSYYNPLIIGDPDLGSAFVNRSSDQDIIRNFSERNGYKLPMYHRLDVGINFEKEKKRVDRTWSFGVYNIYSRKNAFYLYSSQGTFEDSPVVEKRVYQVTMLPFLPYVRYSIRF